MGNATVPASNTVALFTLPPSYCAATFYNLNAQAVFIGTSSAGTTVNGFQCHSIPTSINSYMGSKGATFWGTTGNATASSVQFIIVTDF